MNLAKELGALQPDSRGSNECKVCWAMKTAPEEDRDAVRNALAARASFTAIAEALRRNGYDVSADTLRRHTRNGHTL